MISSAELMLIKNQEDKRDFKHAMSNYVVRIVSVSIYWSPFYISFVGAIFFLSQALS